MNELTLRTRKAALAAVLVAIACLTAASTASGNSTVSPPAELSQAHAAVALQRTSAATFRQLEREPKRKGAVEVVVALRDDDVARRRADVIEQLKSSWGDASPDLRSNSLRRRQGQPRGHRPASAVRACQGGKPEPRPRLR
jgi:hypothetical protein